ncbi:MAG: DEAD/DEAH box helicase [Treponema sp.]|jgi:ATP-dependent Lhr-like helicase|nr:DEAD/DEAH box helicase [Treponema sp.]
MCKPPFERLAPFIREYIFREKWRSLRPVQEAAVGALFDTTDNLLVAAGTASGKTEAVFFPLLSVLASSSGGKQGPRPTALCISPLKALINDQYERLTRMVRTEGGESPVRIWRWHGDVGADHKKQFTESPEGILLITPESLEALLLRYARRLDEFFGALFFIVIDEVHVFMGSDRGSQLLCQLARIENGVAARGFRRRRIGLSATLGDYGGAKKFLALGSGAPSALVIGGETKLAGRKISLALDAFNDSGVFYRALYRQCRDRRAIIFTNSRLEAEEIMAALRKLGKRLGEADIFHIHHGSVSAAQRGEAEATLKHGEGPVVAAATATLELGIDIGDLDRIIQIGPPWSVSAFVQRIGRSGRRSGRAEMYFALMQAEALTGSDFLGGDPRPAALPWDLLRTIAVLELYLGERWIEEPAEKPLPFSLLVHQILAALASLGEHRPEALERRILRFPPFAKISASDFHLLLRHLERCGMTGKTEEGGLILGLEGERIVNRHGFYSVFTGERQYRVLFEGNELGTINFAPAPMSVITVGGRYWQVDRVDGFRGEIAVSATGDSGSERIWRGRGGGIHRRIAQKMYALLAGGASADAFPYLSPSARASLDAGRAGAREWGLAGKALVPGAAGAGADAGVREFFLFPREGSAGTRTIDFFLRDGAVRQKCGILRSSLSENGIYFTVETRLGETAFRAALVRALRAFSVPETGVDAPYTDKYDYLLPRELLAKQYAANMLESEALGRLEKLLDVSAP